MKIISVSKLPFNFSQFIFEFADKIFLEASPTIKTLPSYQYAIPAIWLDRSPSNALLAELKQVLRGELSLLAFTTSTQKDCGDEIEVNA